ncbi:MAG: flagellar motor switch protein FliM [Planctomycetes bacterium]|nr:flagellar motor switch protein FliM [Planctomycetota bacterium]
MPKVLSQNEVDALAALLNKVQPGERGAAPGSAPAASERAKEAAPSSGLQGGGFYNLVAPEEVSIIDFKRPDRVLPEQVNALEAIHESFARNVSSSLAGYLRSDIEVRLISVEQFTYSEFNMSIPTPTIINRLTCEPLEGNMVLEINPSIVFPIIDRLLGGGVSKTPPLDRPFTLIEKGLVNSILWRLLDHLKASWEPIKAINFKIVETESNPSLMQIVPPNEPVILLSFEVVMGEQSGLINLCIPFKMIEPIIKEFSQSNWFSTTSRKGSPEDRGRIVENLKSAPLNISVTLAEIHISLSDLLTLQPGDILDCGVPKETELYLSIEKECLYKGKPGFYKRKRALMITDVSGSGSSAPPARFRS